MVVNIFSLKRNLFLSLKIITKKKKKRQENTHIIITRYFKWGNQYPNPHHKQKRIIPSSHMYIFSVLRWKSSSLYVFVWISMFSKIKTCTWFFLCILHFTCCNERQMQLNTKYKMNNSGVRMFRDLWTCNNNKKNQNIL